MRAGVRGAPVWESCSERRTARTVLPYVQGLLVNEDVIDAERVVEHFARYGLACKTP